MAILENIDIDIGIDRDILSEGAYSRPLNSYVYSVAVHFIGWLYSCKKTFLFLLFAQGQ